ncbi:MAG: hypothetical protein MI975_21070 [Cytophagales bacterium]|nr:hypothetical protein [Cytophagales bacterium]
MNTTTILNENNWQLYGGFLDIPTSINDRSISFVKILSEKLKEENSQKIATLNSLLDDSIAYLQTKKLSKKQIITWQKDLSNIIKISENFLGLQEKYDIDDPISQQIFDCLKSIISKMMGMKKMVDEYYEVAIAREEIRKGDIVPLDDILNELHD